MGNTKDSSPRGNIASKITILRFAVLLFFLSVYVPAFSASAKTKLISDDELQYVLQALPPLISSGENMRSNQKWNVPRPDGVGYAANFSSNARFLVITSPVSPVEIWDVNARKLLKTIKGKKSKIEGKFVDISRDSKIVAFSIGNLIELRNTDTNKLVHSMPALSGALAKFSPSGKLFAARFEGKHIQLWDISRKERVHIFSGHRNNVTSLAFSPDGSLMISGDLGGFVSVWDVKNKALLHTFTRHGEPIKALAISPDNRHALSADYKGETKLWDIRGKKLLYNLKDKKIGNPGIASVASFDPNGQQVAIGYNRRLAGKKPHVDVWNVSTGKLLNSLTGLNANINAMIYKPKTQALILSLDDKEIQLWDILTHNVVDTFGGQVSKADNVATSSDGKLIATGTEEGDVHLWDAHNKRMLYLLKGRNRGVSSLSFSNDGRFIMVGDGAGRVTLWGRNNKKRLLQIQAHKYGKVIAALSPDSKYLVTSSSESSILKLWDVETKQALHTFIGHFDKMNDVAFSPDGNHFVSASQDGTVKLWNVQTKELEHTFLSAKKVKEFLSVAYSPNGQYLAAGTNSAPYKEYVIEVWDVKKRKHLHTLEGHKKSVKSVNFNAESNLLVSGSADGFTKIWDFKRGKVLHTLKQNVKGINSVSFTRDSKNVLVIGGDGVTQFWNLAKETLTHALLDGPRGTWISEDYLRKTVVRGDDGMFPPKILQKRNKRASAKEKKKQTLVITVATPEIHVSNGARTKIRLQIENRDKSPAYWVRAGQIELGRTPVTVISGQLSRLDPGKTGILELKLSTRKLKTLEKPLKTEVKLELVTAANLHYPISIPVSIHPQKKEQKRK